MPYEQRPSPARVAGVVRRYLKHVEAEEALALDRNRFKDEHMTVCETQIIMYRVLIGEIRGLFNEIFQDNRTVFLSNYRDAIEGKAPGHEFIAQYALYKCKDSGDFPLVSRSIESRHEND